MTAVGRPEATSAALEGPARTPLMEEGRDSFMTSAGVKEVFFSKPLQSEIKTFWELGGMN